jgi:hypothetical protein
MPKPSSKPNWTVGNPDIATITVEPTNSKKQAGWLPDERPPREFMNWLFFNLGEWVDYLEEVTDDFADQSIIYDAFVGGGGTHADINALMADPDIANLKNILVVSTLAIDNIQEVDQPGMTFTFKAGAGITKNGPTGADVGIRLAATADRTRIINGRFVGFNDPGVDKAIEILSDNNIISCCMFNDCDTEIDDTTGNSVSNGNLTEV